MDECGVMQRMVAKLLNNANEKVSDKDTKLDVLAILSNVAIDKDGCGAREAVKQVLGDVSEWFDEWMSEDGKRSVRGEEGYGNDDHDEEGYDNNEHDASPEIHKAMLLLLSRAFDYCLKTEDVLELCRDDRSLALQTVVGILEDGESYATELVQRTNPGVGQVGQWEHELVTKRHEKPLILQMCRLLKGFTTASTYFADVSPNADIQLHEVESFTQTMDGLMDITLKTRLVEKLALALHDVLFASDFDESDDEEEEDWDSEDENWTAEKSMKRQQQALRQLEKGLLDGSDHRSICAVFSFLQNLYNFAGTEKAQVYRQHLLADTLLVPRLVLPYLNRCVAAANLLSRRAETYDALLGVSAMKERGESKDDNLDGDAALALDDMPLVAGISAALRLLVIASFRAPPTRFVLGLLRRLNPTTSLLRASSFVARHDYLFSLLCLLNVNMGALDLSSGGGGKGLGGLSDGNGDEEDDDDETDANLVEAYYAHSLLHDMANVQAMMTAEQQQKVINRVLVSGALPIQRDCPSFAAVKSMLEGGAAGTQADYIGGKLGSMGMDDNSGGGSGGGANMGITMDEATFREQLRAEAKQRSNTAQQQKQNVGSVAESKEEDGDEADEAKGDDAMAGEDAAEASRKKKEKKEKKEKREKKEKKKQKQKQKDMGLLGDLPSLEGMMNPKNNTPSKKEYIPLDLDLPEKMKRVDEMRRGSQVSAASTRPKGGATSEIPSEFCCAINGHIMKEPVKTPGGLVFERSTIEVWLESRGSVCPISGNSLSKEDLVDEEELRYKISAWQIKKTSMGNVVRNEAGEEEDVYDF
jgi:hypothetical protein